MKCPACNVEIKEYAESLKLKAEKANKEKDLKIHLNLKSEKSISNSQMSVPILVASWNPRVTG